MEGIRTERAVMFHPPLEIVEPVQVSRLPDSDQNVLVGFSDEHGHFHRIVRVQGSNLPSAKIQEIF